MNNDRVISSDDPDAIDRLKNKLERERGVAKNISTLELFNKKLKNHRDIELLKSNIM